MRLSVQKKGKNRLSYESICFFGLPELREGQPELREHALFGLPELREEPPYTHAPQTEHEGDVCCRIEAATSDLYRLSMGA